ncbi:MULTISPECIES: Stk1 family PASTA domain-containing Ser/Thr kinase [unclassified Microbacterium]|uniref:Stk1 family PASTA domain-containing Ser/Thr kinase n=1 Tax=unclassified Microbacterium TaxID=2609290 RepID=UPI0006F9621A|nr:MULTISPECIES: Stk1 family PASTA domain-containing Ser/Thr kinase [unclassified Microbacterium]MBD8207485.1 Stk1 family PASTA domain-containing Ser/Thr kinase [Microbacterium sp. CFBP 8801]MBD8217375.1 Stk1 family PASTA domain-containing Ser/Thr kinase [Microbacterium sp. CFBP 13617]MBD8477096.1 Stk1 family PASTA domain-containing Ser/Thr kinase [Microbacterium sp. CFBP 8794]MBD8509045.1 Stk1 family PASTA domain-containing Ser/Thr kinase [Microbacterium sp. CFBP 8790]AOX45909.1 serine/threon
MTTETRVLSGRYRVDDLIGRGGMASVYRGYDQTLGRTVAIKILRTDLAGDAAFRTRFRLEAQAASRMAHPTIVRVFDAGEDVETGLDGNDRPVPYIVMELVQGRLLKDVIAEGPVPTDDALRYVDGILEALEYSHRAGVVHRDIKPGNVMITEAGRVKVMDFGIARAVSDSSSTVAETTAIVGTAAYFSPEQAKGESVDARADLYSAGVVLYELLAGRTPFRGDTPVAVAYQHVSEAPLPPSEINDTIPRALDAIVLRALAKDPFQRPQDAASFREALDETVDGKAPTKRQMSALSNELYGPNPRQAAETARSLRQLSTDTTMRRTQAGPPVAWIWAGVTVLAVLLVAVLIWVMQIQQTDDVPTTSLAVPNVVDMSYERAVETLEAEQMTTSRVNESSETIAAGNVTRSTPEADTSVAAGQLVTLYVSTGPDTAKVPTLDGITETEARTALEAAGLSVGSIRRQTDPALAGGTVISSSLASGSDVAKGTTVNLVVASGQIVIVDYTGYTVDAAKRELESDAKQLTVQVTEDPGCRASSPATVKTQSLAPGEVPVHSEITLTTCSGS